MKRIERMDLIKIICLVSVGVAVLLMPLGFACNQLDAGEPKGFRTNGLQRLKYNNPGLVVDLGVGLWAWPLPVDYDQDGDLDLVVSSPDKPYNGTYFFENPGTGKLGDGKPSTGGKMPVFKPGVRISRGLQNVQISWVDGKTRVLTPGREHHEFFQRGLDTSKKLPVPANIHGSKIRGNQWSYCDFDGDGAVDLIVGVGDWSEYGWDDGYDAQGRWKRGPLRGFVYWLRNEGTSDRPKYAKAKKITGGGKPVDVYGRPSPNFADFDGDGDLDLICGEFLDKFSYFENIGSRRKPKYAARRWLGDENKPIAMELEMIAPTAIDWDGDGDVDLIVGDEDGRVALVEHTGQIAAGVPQFLPPKYFKQQAEYLMCGALATPCGFDWDGDGDDDIISGNTAGFVEWFENLGPAAGDDKGDNNTEQQWAAPRRLSAAGKTIRITAGPNGSIQGPCEAKWGYTTLTVGDWDHDSRPDVMVNSIWGKVLWYRNIGSRREPVLEQARRVEVQWPGKPPKPAWFWWTPQEKSLVTQWRTTPVVVDWNADQLRDLVMLDHEGYLALFARRRQAGKGGKLELMPGQRIFVDEQGNAIRLSSGHSGRSGRRKLAATDWDGDGRVDLLLNSSSAEWWRNVATRDGKTVLKNMGTLDPRPISGHTSSPTAIDLNRDGVPDLLVGAEDGFFYYAENPRRKAE